MSTQKFRLKQVIVFNKRYPCYRDDSWFETKDGEKFKPVDFDPIDYPNDKIYVVKKLNVVRANKWAYELYEVPRIDLTYNYYWNGFCWKGRYWKKLNNSFIVYEIKR